MEVLGGHEKDKNKQNIQRHNGFKLPKLDENIKLHFQECMNFSSINVKKKKSHQNASW